MVGGFGGGVIGGGVQYVWCMFVSHVVWCVWVCVCGVAFVYVGS